MQKKNQETIKHKTNKELEAISKNFSSYSAEERLTAVIELEKKGVSSHELTSLKRNLEENVRESKKMKQKIAAKQQEEWTGEPITLAEGIKDMTPMKVLKVLFYQSILSQERALKWFPIKSQVIGRAFMFLYFGLTLPLLIFIGTLARYQFDFEFPMVGAFILSLFFIALPLYFLLVFDGKAEEICKKKPAMFNNHRYSGYFFGIVMGVPFLAMILLLFYLGIRQDGIGVIDGILKLFVNITEAFFSGRRY
ncbi:MAG: hypothetical protein LBI15_02635 [Dysgonamonadaceae bacterium]|jgi:hypothetical protein|nr:hypothetical protein [Dysgonamonadaceae bacterium]